MSTKVQPRRWCDRQARPEDLNYARRRPTVAGMPSSFASPPRPDHVALLSRLWPDVPPVDVVTSAPVTAQLPAKAERCGIYVLSFADGQLYVGQAVDVARRYAQHRKTYDDIVGLQFWRFQPAELDAAEQAAIHQLQQAGLLLRNVAYASGRLGASDLDSLVSAAEQQVWLVSTPGDVMGYDVRPDRVQQRVSGRTRFRKLAADPRFAAVLPAVRRYVSRTVPMPRRTEFSRWSISACPRTNENTWPRLLTVTVHALETLFVYSSVDKPHESVFSLNVDLATMEQHYGGDLNRLADAFGAAYFREAVYRVRPGVLGLRVEGARNFKRLLDVDGVVAAARRLNLDMMRKGPAMQWRSHSFELADRLFAPVEDVVGEDALHRALAYDLRGDVPAAELLYRQAAAGGDAEAAFRLAELHTERGDDDQATVWHRRAEQGGYHGVRRSPEFANTYAWRQWAQQHAEHGDPDRAAVCYELAAEGGATAHYLDLGDVLADPDLAAAAYQRAADCGHAGGWYGLGLLHDERGDMQDARACYRRAAQAGHLEALVHLGWLHHGDGDLEQALDCYQRAALAGHVDALVSLGDVARQRDDLVEAGRCYRRAVDRGSLTGLVGLGILRQLDGDVAQAHVWYQQAVDEGHTPALVNLGCLYLNENDPLRAQPYLSAAVAAGQTDAHRYLADVLDELGDHEAAVQQYRLAAESGDEEAAAHLRGLASSSPELVAA
ncbi:tetratricopeptide repeat protein [Actinoplanes sp. URMC 104]|uniref:tetratricopeptide repeat protein n=1 Tax=Actinoplanes sp. URMC 104 TaxID=3423409 RepID=UPI003F1956F4